MRPATIPATTAMAALTAALLFASAQALAQAPDVQAKVALTDSTAAPLAGTRRVAITNVVISFQASAGGEKTNTSGLFAAKTDASATLQMPEMDTRLLAEIADEAYQQLRLDLQANGFEVLPEAAVVASPAYKKILAMAGYTNFSKFANMNGDVMLVGATGLTPYLTYNAETGKFEATSKSLIKGWIESSWGTKSSTEGGPTGIRLAEIYALPGLEVDLAKELNANLVKAHYVVTLGSTKASAKSSFAGSNAALGTNTFKNSYQGSAFAQVGLLAGQSRIAFRTPAASSKGESASRGYTANFGSNASPAKDGDVVVCLAESLLGSTEVFAIAEPETKKSSLLGSLLGAGGGTGADVQFAFTASIGDPAAYRAEVIGMLTVAQRDMLALVKR